MKSLNILILASALPYPLDDGGKLILFPLIKILSSSHRITLLSFINSEEEKKYVSYMGKYCEVHTVVRKRKNSMLNRVRFVFTPFPYGASLNKSTEMRSALRELLLSRSFDLLHCHYSHMAQYVSGKFIMPKLIYAVDCDSLIYERRMRAEKNPVLRAYLWWQWLRNIYYEATKFRVFDAAVTVSEPDSNALRRSAPGLKTFVVPNGVDTEYFKPSLLQERKKRILFTGVMDYHPNVDAAVYVAKYIMPHVWQNMPDAEFYIVGRNPTAGILKLSAMDKRIVVTGYVEDIRPYFDASSVYACYMLTGSGIKNKVLEAMAMGVPVVANTLSMNSIAALNGKDFLKADTPEAFADNIVLLLKDKTFADKIGTSGRDFVIKHHGWHTTADVMNRIYETLICRNKI